MNKYLILSLSLILSYSSLIAQKKVKGLPEALKQPKDYFENPEVVRKNLFNKTTDKDKREPWIVVSDRTNNSVYKTSSTSSEVVKELEFREWFYVVDDKEDWIKIATANKVNKLKSKSIESIGWIPKNKMLLWTSGLIDYKTKIHKKAFLLNKAEDVIKVLKNKSKGTELIVDFYDDPNADVKGQDRKIYDFYFVFKKENDMMLLSEEETLTGFNMQSKLLGWVHKNRIDEWNTRISLEPNFKDDAYAERKGNRDLQFRAFGKDEQVRKFVENGSLDGVFWDNDPVKFKANIMAESNSKRFKGNVVRFPMFQKGKLGETEFFRSGVIGSVKIGATNNGEFRIEKKGVEEYDYAKMKDMLVDLKYRNKNVNLFFVIEGTNKTYGFKNGILNAIQSLESNSEFKNVANVQYGALIYRDIPEGNRIIEYEKLTPNLSKVNSFISQSDFSNRIDQDDETAMYYGLKQSLKVAGFDNKALNIVVIIGSNGDYWANKTRREEAKRNNDKSFIGNEGKDQIFRELSGLDAHLYSIQLHNEGRVGTSFGRQSHGFILEAAKYQHNKNTTGSRLSMFPELSKNMSAPYMDLPDGQNKVVISGAKPGVFILPSKNESLTDDKIKSGLNEMVEKSIKYEQGLLKIFENVFEIGNPIDLEMAEENGLKIPDMANGATTEILKILKAVNPEDVAMVMNGIKLNLYTEVYLPIKARGSNHSLSSFVLFMPESDLVNYQNLINKNLSSASFGSYPEKRKSLYQIYLALIEEFTGEDFSKKKAEKMTREQVMKIMQGVEAEGLELDVDLDVRIGGIQNENEVSNEEIDRLIRRFNDVNEGLENLLRILDRSDFCLTSDGGNRYYWLRLDEVF